MPSEHSHALTTCVSRWGNTLTSTEHQRRVAARATSLLLRMQHQDAGACARIVLVDLIVVRTELAPIVYSIFYDGWGSKFRTTKCRTTDIFRNFKLRILHGENIIAIFTTLSAVIWFPMGNLRIFATLVYVFTMRVVTYEILSMAIIPTLSTSILFCNLCYILL